MAVELARRVLIPMGCNAPAAAAAAAAAAADGGGSCCLPSAEQQQRKQRPPGNATHTNNYLLPVPTLRFLRVPRTHAGSTYRVYQATVSYRLA